MCAPGACATRAQLKNMLWDMVSGDKVDLDKVKRCCTGPGGIHTHAVMRLTW
jgi:hypothetical protein